MSELENGFEHSQAKGNQDVSESFSLNYVSNATIAKILIEKGICTRDELVANEHKFRELKGEVKAFHPVQIERDTTEGTQSQKNNNNWLKQKMSKRRWSRSLGTFLFGWQWRKTKISMPGQIQPVNKGE